MLNCRIRELEEAGAATAAELEKIRLSLHSAEAQLETADAELDSSKAELEAIKADLDSSRAELESFKAEVAAAGEERAAEAQEVATLRSNVSASNLVATGQCGAASFSMLCLQCRETSVCLQWYVFVQETHYPDLITCRYFDQISPVFNCLLSEL